MTWDTSSTAWSWSVCWGALWNHGRAFIIKMGSALRMDRKISNWLSEAISPVKDFEMSMPGTLSALPWRI